MYNTCVAENVTTFYRSTDAFKYSFFQYTILEWNKLDWNIQQSKAMLKLKFVIKDWLTHSLTDLQHA